MPCLILNTAVNMDGPYQTKPGPGGMTAYPPKAMDIVCVLVWSRWYHAGRWSATSGYMTFNPLPTSQTNSKNSETGIAIHSRSISSVSLDKRIAF